MENNLNEEIVEFLREEEKDLRTKAKGRREALDMPMYKNLINAYEKVVELIKKYDWRLLWSKYGNKLPNGTFIDCISIWEQNGDDICRNHKMFGRVDLDKIVFNKGDKILFEGNKYFCICVDNEYATFAIINDDGGSDFSKIIVFDNKIENQESIRIRYEKLN